MSVALEQCRAECAEFQSRAEIERVRANAQGRAAQDALRQMEEARQELGNAKLEFEKDITSARRLTDTYKRARDDAMSKSSELEEALKATRNELDSRDEIIARAKERIVELGRDVQHVRKELDKSQKQLAAAQKIAGPLLELHNHRHADHHDGLEAALEKASRNVPKGLSVTESFAKFVQTLEQLNAANAEISNLERLVKATRAEAEEKLLSMSAQMKDQEQLLKMNHMLSTRLASAHRMEEENNLMRREGAKLMQDLRDLKNENGSLCRQIQVLLSEQKKLKATPPSRRTSSILASPMSQSENHRQLVVANSMNEIAVVPFKNISELVQQNTELQSLLRKQTLQPGQAQANGLDSEVVQKYETVIANLKKDVSERDEQIATIETYLNEQKSAAHAVQNAAPLAIMQVSHAEAQERADTKELLRIAQQELEMLRSDKVEAEKQLQQSIDEAREQDRQTKLQLIQAQSEKNSIVHKLQWIEPLKDRLEKDIQRLRDDNARLLASLKVEQEKVRHLDIVLHLLNLIDVFCLSVG